MKESPYYFEIRDILNQFVGAFDDVTIKRFNKQREPKNQVKVRYIYAPKSRILHNLVNKAEHITLPAIAVTVGGIQRAKDRVFNKTYGMYLKNTNDAQKIKTPIPIDITVNMSIITRYTADMDQIISNFVPYNNPYVVISWKVPTAQLGNFSDLEIRSHVHWNEDISYEYPNEITDSDPWRLIVNTSFKIEGWLFKDHQEPSSPIYYIDTNFYTVSGGELEDWD
jgi:hypothetical protein